MPLTALLLASCFAAADGRTDYLLYCGGCHLEDGTGDPPEVPNLRIDVDRFAASDAGRAYLTQVPGAAQVPISDARLAAVLNWMLANYYPERTFASFNAAEVATHRGQRLMDPLKKRQELLEALESP
ncbi:MAG: hypothetical protein AAGG11_18535 [Pseudomonadota bacterium]